MLALYFPAVIIAVSHLEEGWLTNPGQMSGMAEERGD